MAKRHDEIYRRYLAGEPINDIAKAYGVIGMRIKQIISKKEREIKQEAKPLPCLQDEHGEIRAQTVKQLVAKIDEELNELKALVFPVIIDNLESIAEEAADTITAITTLEEYYGIDAAMRDEAQRRVNQKNHKRGRLFLTTTEAAED